MADFLHGLDKIAASKRKGLWVGGPVPLGYRCIDKKTEIVPEEAEVVRTIFSCYLERGSIGALLAELDRRGHQDQTLRPSRRPQEGRHLLRHGSLAHLLKNRFVMGMTTEGYSEPCDLWIVVA
jgi:site-specific DNA recombinase